MTDNDNRSSEEIQSEIWRLMRILTDREAQGLDAQTFVDKVDEDGRAICPTNGISVYRAFEIAVKQEAQRQGVPLTLKMVVRDEEPRLNLEGTLIPATGPEPWEPGWAAEKTVQLREMEARDTK